MRPCIPDMTLIYYMLGKEGGRWLPSIEDSVDASIQRLEDNIEKRGGRLITAIRSNTDDTSINRTITRKEKWEKNNPMDVLSD